MERNKLEQKKTDKHKKIFQDKAHNICLYKQESYNNQSQEVIFKMTINVKLKKSPDRAVYQKISRYIQTKI